MPRPGSKKSNKKKVKASGAGRDLSNVDIPNVLDAFVDEISDTRGWESIVRILCRMFELPNFETRSGLKTIHANFPEIQGKLEGAYNKYNGNEKVMGGIVGIWARMSVDSILRDRLFRRGLVSKMMPLLDIRSTRHVGLQALTTVTHHGGGEVRREIARHAPRLLRLMEEFPADEELNELVIVTLDHAACAILTEKTADVQATRQLNMPVLLKHTLNNIRRPAASYTMLTHALELLTNSTLNCSRDVMAIPAIVSLLVACLRSDDLTMRCSVMGGLFRLYNNEAERDTTGLDPQKFLDTLQRGIPPHLSDILMAYDPKACDTYLTLQCHVDHTKAMVRCVQDYDLLALGRKLARLVVTTEYSVADGGFEAINPRTGRAELDNMGLPFTMWMDALPVCAKSLRETGNPSDKDMADIIELKFLISRQRIPEAVELAQRAVDRSPEVAYYYYAISLGPNASRGLRACKKGLKCKQITPFVRSYLRWRAVDHAGDLGLIKLASATTGDAEYAEGIAFITSALEDAKAFVSETSPDNRHMPTMLNWHILLTIALKGSELSPDLRELNDAFKKLEMTREFNNFFGTRQHNTNLKLTRELVVSRYREAWAEWSSFIMRLDGLHSRDTTQERVASKAEDNLAAWLEGLHIEGEDDGTHHCARPKISTRTMELYRCSHCNNPSAVLRKCSGCGKTRYCDSACQKQHWAEHKTTCKAAQSQS